MSKKSRRENMFMLIECAALLIVIAIVSVGATVSSLKFHASIAYGTSVTMPQNEHQ